MYTELIKISNQNILTLAEAKNHLRITTTHEDNYINSLLDVITETIENEIQQDLVDTDYIFKMVGAVPVDTDIIFPFSPVFNVSVKIYNGEEEIINNFSYSVSSERINFDLLPLEFDRVEVKFKKEYRDKANVQKAIKQAGLLLLTDLFQFRSTFIVGKSIVQIQNTVNRLLQPYKKVSVL
jgi:uncharacterized phiE125 gp8 family phage protein